MKTQTKKGYTMLNIIQKLQNALTEGKECKVWIEDSDSYEGVTVNIKQLLQALAVNEDYYAADYTLYCGGLNRDRDDNKLGFIQTLHANAAMLNVFMTEEEAIEFVNNYDIEEEECNW